MKKTEIKVPCRFFTLLGIGITAIGLLSGAYGMVYEVPIWKAVGIVFTLMGLFTSVFFTGSCSAEDDGLTVKMPLRETRVIPYDDIDWVTLDVRLGSSSKGSPYYSLKYNMKIITRGDTLTFEVVHGNTNSPADLYDIRRKEFLLMNSPFKEIERKIRLKKGMDPAADILGLSR